MNDAGKDSSILFMYSLNTAQQTHTQNETTLGHKLLLTKRSSRKKGVFCPMRQCSAQKELHFYLYLTYANNRLMKNCSFKTF